MFRYPDATYRISPPVQIECEGYLRNFNDLTREQWDRLGYNEAIPVTREPFTKYTTHWEKGDDLIFHEVITESVVDESARDAHTAVVVRTERDSLLTQSDWTQLADSPLDDAGRQAWADYRGHLRNVPQQEGFPATIQWPQQPE